MLKKNVAKNQQNLKEIYSYSNKKSFQKEDIYYFVNKLLGKFGIYQTNVNLSSSENKHLFLSVESELVNFRGIIKKIINDNACSIEQIKSIDKIISSVQYKLNNTRQKLAKYDNIINNIKNEMNFLIKQFNLNSFIYIKEAKDKIKKNGNKSA